MDIRNMDDIAEMFRNIRFRKKFFGGVDEQDVWKQLDDIQRAYRSAYEAQAVHYETILAQYGIGLPADSDPARTEYL